MRTWSSTVTPVTQDTQHRETLAELVASARAAHGMSLRDVERTSGGVVGHTTVHQIETGHRATVNARTLAGLSTALGVPQSRLRAAMGQPARVPAEPFRLPDAAQLLTAKQRRLVVALIHALVEARGEA